MRGRVYTPEAYAALHARGYLGFEHMGVGGVWVPDRRIRAPEAIRPDSCPRGPFGWLPPPMIAPGLDRRRSIPLGFVTADATSNVYVPQSAAEWSSLNSPNVTTWDALWLLQEASGNFADTIGSFTLTAAGTISYAQSVTGWSTTGFKTTDNTAGQATTSSSSLSDLRTQDVTILLYGILNATPAGNRDIIDTGGSNEFRARVTSTPRLSIVDNSNSAAGSNSPSAVVWPFILAVGNTVSTVQGYGLKDKVAPTYGAGTSASKFLRIGGNSGSALPPNFTFMYAAMKKAYIVEVDVASLIDNLDNASGNFARTWTTAFTGAVSESDSVSESVGVVYSIPLALSESDSLSESTAALVSFVGSDLSLAETDNLSESTDASEGIAYGVSESESVSEAASDGPMQANVPLSESLSLSEALAAAQSIAIALSESESFSEAMSALMAVAVALDEAEDLTEEVTAAQSIAIGLSESESETESLASLLAVAIAFSESEAVAEAVAAQQSIAIALSEAESLSEQLSALLSLAVGLSESEATTESTALQMAVDVAFADALAIVESLSAVKASTVALAEAAVAAEAIATKLSQFVNLADALAVAERVALHYLYSNYLGVARALEHRAGASASKDGTAMSFDMNAGDLEPDMLIHLTVNGLPENVNDQTAMTMVWTRPDGTEDVLAVIPVVGGDGSVTKVLHQWLAGETDMVGVHRGKVVVTRGGGGQQTFPSDASHVRWQVHPRQP